MMNKDIFLTNNLSNKKEKFVPIDENNVGMYVVVLLYMMTHILVTLDR